MKLNKQTREYLKQKVVGYVSKDQKSDELTKYLRLDLGENLLGCSPKITTAIKNLEQDDLCLYADPSASNIKTTIANLYGILPENVLIGNSSNEVIDFLPKMVIEKNDPCLTIIPTFFRFKESSLAAGGKILALRLYQENKFKPDSQLIDNITSKSKKIGAKLIWICNPNNPTGEVYEPDQIIEIVKKSESFVVIDEAFYEYYDPENKHSAINLVSKYKNLLVLRTLSKAYGLAGIRFGYGVGNKEVIRDIENYRNTLLMTSAVVQKIAKVALEDQVYLKNAVMQTSVLRKNLFNSISKIKDIELGALSKTNIYLLKHKHKNLYDELLKRKVLTANFNNVDGIKKMGYVRITVAKEEENIKLIKILGEL